MSCKDGYSCSESATALSVGLERSHLRRTFKLWVSRGEKLRDDNGRINLDCHEITYFFQSLWGNGGKQYVVIVWGPKYSWTISIFLLIGNLWYIFREVHNGMPLFPHIGSILEWVSAIKWALTKPCIDFKAKYFIGFILSYVVVIYVYRNSRNYETYAIFRVEKKLVEW